MYLSELFLDAVGNDFSNESVNRALQLCEAERRSREVSEEELIDYADVTAEFYCLE